MKMDTSRSNGIQFPAAGVMMECKTQLGTQGKGILTPGIDRCIVKDEKCPNLLKKNRAKTADGGLLVTALSLHDL